jgi:hypothetical protein
VARKVAAAEPRDQVRFWQGRFRQAGSRSDDAEGQGPSHQIGVPEMAKDIVKVPYPNLGGLSRPPRCPEALVGARSKTTIGPLSGPPVPELRSGAGMGWRVIGTPFEF